MASKPTTTVVLTCPGAVRILRDSQACIRSPLGGLEDRHGATQNHADGHHARARATPRHLDGCMRPRSGVVLATRSHRETARPPGPTGATRHLASTKSTRTADATRATGPPDPTPPSRATTAVGDMVRWPGAHRCTPPRPGYGPDHAFAARDLSNVCASAGDSLSTDRSARGT
jgi:hypothetical protein